MNARFAHPEYFWALAALVPLVAVSTRSWISRAVRLLVAASLVAACASPGREHSIPVTGRVVVAKDISSSMRPGELAAVPGGEAVAFERPGRGIAEAVALAGPGGAVILASDARWSAEELDGALREARRTGIPVLRQPMPASTPDAAPAWVEATGPLRDNEPGTIAALVVGEPGASGEALLLIDDAPAGRQPYAGERTMLRFPVTLPAGWHALAVRLEARVDGEPRNNIALGGVEVRGGPRVLVLEGRAGAAAAIAAALEAQGIAIVRGTLAGGTDPGDFAAVVVAGGVPPADLAKRLETAVLGGAGLFVVAAPEDAEGWIASSLAPLLPLTVRPPPPPPPIIDPDPGTTGTPAPAEETPRVLLIVAIDRSGSMSGTKMTAAKEAAIAAAETLGEGDSVGVLAFDSEAHWVIEPTSATARGAIADEVSRLQAGGETDVHVAIVEAGKRAATLKKFPVRHIVLLTDGVTPAADFRSVVEGMAKDGVTVSTVGLGSDFDGRLLSNIAEWGRGRFYFTASEDEIPRIFTQEARRAAANAPPRPAPPEPKPGPKPPPPRDPDPIPVFAGDRDPATDGLADWPAIAAPCGDTLRPGARQLLRAGPKPLLAVVRRSMGRVAAFAAGLDGRGANAWTSWDKYSRFVAQLARTLLRPESGGPSVELQSMEDARRVVVRGLDSTPPRATLDGVELPLEALAGSAWTADVSFPGRFPAARRLDVSGPTGMTSRVVSWNWPVDFTPRAPRELDLPVATPAAIAARPTGERRERETLSRWALAAAVGFLLLEVWLRRRSAA